jgi:hypothetical protein
MKITVPSFAGLKDIPQNMKEVIKILEDAFKAIASFTSNGFIARDNLSYEIVTIINDKGSRQMVTVTHSLKRVPLGFFIQTGAAASLTSYKFDEKSVTFMVTASTTTKIVLL